MRFHIVRIVMSVLLLSTFKENLESKGTFDYYIFFLIIDLSKLDTCFFNKFNFLFNYECGFMSVYMNVKHFALYDIKIYCAKFYEIVWIQYSLYLVTEIFLILHNASHNDGTYLSLDYSLNRKSLISHNVC